MLVVRRVKEVVLSLLDVIIIINPVYDFIQLRNLSSERWRRLELKIPLALIYLHFASLHNTEGGGNIT